jgi:hypothetical protein
MPQDNWESLWIRLIKKLKERIIKLYQLQISNTMKTKISIGFALMVGLLINIGQTNAQSCSGCTTTISTVSANNIFINPGDVVCITSSGSVSGNIIMSGGTLCNEGNISGNILQGAGDFYNHGTISGTPNITHDSGILTNYGSMDMGNYLALGFDIEFTNYGNINGNDFTLNFSGTGARPWGINNGNMLFLNFNLDSADFTNNDSLETTGNMPIGSGAYFNNQGPLHVGVNWTNTDAHFHTICMVQVDNNWVNQGLVTGPLSNNCGGFYVDGLASNYEDLGTDNSYIDVCEQGTPGGLLNNGTMGTNATECTCNNVCVPSTNSINETLEISGLILFPNPAKEQITIEVDENNRAVLRCLIYNQQGQKIDAFTLNRNRHKLAVTNYASGLYLLQITNQNGVPVAIKKFVVE